MTPGKNKKGAPKEDINPTDKNNNEGTIEHDINEIIKKTEEQNKALEKIRKHKFN